MLRFFSSLLLLSLLAGCSINRLPSNLSLAMMNQEDPVVVADGAPAYLLLLDALILTYPNDSDYLLAGARLYSAYAGTFSQDPQRSTLLANKAFDYAKRALCAYDSDACPIPELTEDQLVKRLNDEFDEDEVELFYTFASTWATWIQANSDNWNAIAQLGKVKATLQWVAHYEPAHDNAMVQVYLGVLETQLPPSLGGKPELGRQHFEQAIKLSQGRNLMAYVMFAKQYARLMFEQELHDTLLKEALAATPEQPGLTLINRLAQQQAQQLLAESADFFE